MLRLRYLAHIGNVVDFLVYLRTSTMGIFPEKLLSFLNTRLPVAVFRNVSRLEAQDRESYIRLDSETSGSEENEPEDEGTSMQSYTLWAIRRWPPKRSLRKVLLLPVLLSITVFALLATHLLADNAWSNASAIGSPELELVSMRDIDALYARQSITLAEASSRYSLKTNRPPPENYDKWFKFAQSKSCLIDEYDQIYRDFEPFYQLVEKDPGFFKNMVELGMEKVCLYISPSLTQD